MTKLEKIIDYLQEEMNQYELVALHNDYCQETNNPDSEIFDMDIFDEIFNGCTPTQIANNMYYGTYNPCHEFFTFDGYGNIESFPKYQVNDYVDISEIANYMVDNNWDDEINDILYILDVWEDGEEE